MLKVKGLMMVGLIVFVVMLVMMMMMIELVFNLIWCVCKLWLFV